MNIKKEQSENWYWEINEARKRLHLKETWGAFILSLVNLFLSLVNLFLSFALFMTAFGYVLDDQPFKGLVVAVLYLGHRIVEQEQTK